MKAIVVGVIGMGLLVAGYQSLYRSRNGKILEKWETGNHSFRVRVISYEEKNKGFAPGAYYVFESTPALTEQWREIITVRHDDPVPIPRNQVRFVNDRVGYIFMGWTFAVTTTGGSDWTVWRADQNLPNWQCCNYKLIKDVTIAPDGSGVMTLNPIPGREGEVPMLHTKNYGQHWMP